ncbi:aquaporin Z [Aureibacter tunicatorum]|uniref:Aquaporin Z n=1 Tax=Aureibacter tunicatorum TaxID=866807 RepID=A0AAE3XME5_9BACT|nr:aquaporin Z [Aureibacter tunicatorum]MDR6239165.1 aquaporin Z [Aureibacter tunicatorum]BDD04909.1 aquaporin Z [Aureibacter tunicatorum]
MKTINKLSAEFIGTFWLVLAGCGSAVLASTSPDTGIGTIGVSLAFGLTILTMIYAFGHISGAHFNPAVTIGLAINGKFNKKELLPYILTQILGAICGAIVLYIIANGKEGFDINQGFAANGFGQHSPGGYSLPTALITEFIMTFMFILIILGATDELAPKGFAGISIGLSLMLIHMISIPVTNTSVNPARSISQAIFVGDWAIQQLWVFLLAPIAGAVMAGMAYKIIRPKLNKLKESQPIEIKLASE